MAGKYGTMQDQNQSSTSSFSPTEFLIIKESIYNNVIYIKKQVTKLDKILKLIGSKNDNVELRNKM